MFKKPGYVVLSVIYPAADLVSYETVISLSPETCLFLRGLHLKSEPAAVWQTASREFFQKTVRRERMDDLHLFPSGVGETPTDFMALITTR